MKASVLATTTLLATFMSVGVAAAQDNVFRLMTWEGYADDKWIEAFEAETGADVQVTFVGGIDEIFAQITASDGGGFDLITIETSTFKRLTDEGLVQPIDMSRVPNAANLLPAFSSVDAIIFDGKQYSVPFAWGSIPMIVDAKQFDELPTSWKVMWDPALAGGILTMDEANNNVVTAALALGYDDPFNLTDEQFEAIRKFLIEQKALVASYYGGFDDGVNIFAKNGIAVMMSMGEPQATMLQDRGVDARLVIPEEGAIGWIDTFAIPSGAKNVDMAYAWINHMLQVEVGTYMSQQTGYGNVTDAAANAAIGMDYSERLVFLEAPEDYTRRQDLWNEVKAAQ